MVISALSSLVGNLESAISAAMDSASRTEFIRLTAAMSRKKNHEVFFRDDKHLLRSPGHPHIRRCWSLGCGCSSGVERNLAKVEVVSSNLITRSIIKSLK